MPTSENPDTGHPHRAGLNADMGVDLCLQGLSVEGGADFGVVVKVDVDVARDAAGVGGAGAAGLSAGCGIAACGPGENAVGPDVECFAFVAAGIKLLRAVKATVNEVGGDVDEQRPLDRVGDDEADVVMAQ